MALTKREQQQMERLQKKMEQDEDEEPEDFEVVIETDNGRVRLPYSKARKLLARMGIDLDDLPDEEEDEEDEDEEADEDEEEEPEEDRPRRHASTHKHVPAKVVKVPAEDEEPVRHGRGYWRK